MGIFGKVTNIVKKLANPIGDTINGRPVVKNVVPFSAATGGAASVASKGQNIVSKGINYIKRHSINQFSGVTIKQGLKNIGKGTLGLSITGGTYGAASEINRARIAGDPISMSRVGNAAITGATFGLNPLGAIVGTAEGYADKGLNAAKELMQKQPTSNLNNPTNPIWNTNPFNKIPQLDIPQHITIDGALPSMAMPQMQPVNISLPSQSFNPSVSAGGGMGDILPLMLLLAGGAGLAGYAAGKKKKKKYKKRKSVKK